MARQTSGPGGGGDDDEIRISADMFEASVNEARAEQGLDPVDTDRSGDVTTTEGTQDEREKERQAARNAARAVTEDDPGFQQEQEQEREEAVQAARNAARAVSEDPGREQAQAADREEAQRAAQQAAEAVRSDPGRSDRRRRRGGQEREEQAGDIRVGIPGTDRTVEGVTEDLAGGFERRVTDPVSRAAGTAADALADPGSVRIETGEQSSRIDTADTTAGDVTETATRSLVGLGNIPATARGVDELLFEPAAEIAAGGPAGEAPDRAERIGEYGYERGAAIADEYFEVSESRLEALQEGDVGSVEDEPLVSVEPDREAEVGGLLAGGIASAGVTGAAFAATQGSRVGGATRWAVQPGEELLITGARRTGSARLGRVAEAVGDVSVDRADSGFSFRRLSDDRGQLTLGQGRRDRDSSDVITSGDILAGDRGREQANFGLGRPSSDRTSEDISTRRPDPAGSDETGSLGYRSARTESEPIGDLPRTESARDPLETGTRESSMELATESALEPDIDTVIRQFEANARRQAVADPVSRAEDRLDLAAEPLTGTDVRSELDGRLDSRLETALDTEMALETRTEIRTEPRLETRLELGQETRTELTGETRQETRLETGIEPRFETPTEITLPDLDRDIEEEGTELFGVRSAARERSTGLATGADLLESFEES